MKKLAVLFAFMLAAINSMAQSKKTDKIIRKDHSIIEAKVSKVSDANIEYVFSGETLVNTINTSQITRIEFANGRTQDFNSTPKSETQTTKQSIGNELQAIRQNTIAILPIPFVNSESLSSSEEMAKFAQNDIYNQLIDKSKNIFPLVVQDVRTTNSLLRKAGIDYKNIDETPIEDLQKILGVDHILASKVSYTLKTIQTTNTLGSGTTTVKDNNKVTGNDFSNSNTVTGNTYDYQVYFDLYRDNSKIYTEARKPFLKQKDSWKDATGYLLKRCPIYKK
jgi:hypothetical protein